MPNSLDEVVQTTNLSVILEVLPTRPGVLPIILRLNGTGCAVEVTVAGSRLNWSRP